MAVKRLCVPRAIQQLLVPIQQDLVPIYQGLGFFRTPDGTQVMHYFQNLQTLA